MVTSSSRTRSLPDANVPGFGIRRPRIGPDSVIIFPLSGPCDGLDVTDALVDALAARIGEAGRGNRVLNRLEAERHLRLVLDATLSLIASGLAPSRG